MTEPLYQSDYWWGVLLRENICRDVGVEYLAARGGVPVVFRTRKAASEWLHREYGHIRRGHELRREPYGWRTPQPIKVRMTVERRP